MSVFLFFLPYFLGLSCFHAIVFAFLKDYAIFYFFYPLVLIFLEAGVTNDFVLYLVFFVNIACYYILLYIYKRGDYINALDENEVYLGTRNTVINERINSVEREAKLNNARHDDELHTLLLGAKTRETSLHSFVANDKLDRVLKKADIRQENEKTRAIMVLNDFRKNISEGNIALDSLSQNALIVYLSVLNSGDSRAFSEIINEDIVAESIKEMKTKNKILKEKARQERENTTWKQHETKSRVGEEEEARGGFGAD